MTVAEPPFGLRGCLGASPDAAAPIRVQPRSDAPALRGETRDLKSSCCNVANVNKTGKKGLLISGPIRIGTVRALALSNYHTRLARAHTPPNACPTF